MQIIETRAISLQASRGVKLSATEERVRTDSIGGPSWAIKYRIAITGDQLASIGPDLSSVNIDVTEFVRQGRLTICRPA